MTGADELRNVVCLMNYCNESFNQKFSLEELLQIFKMQRASEWDILPDEWTPEQIKEALKGVPPYWDKDRRPICGARLRGFRARDALLAQEGGMLSVFIKKKVLTGYKNRNKIFSIKLDKQEFYPAWQFDNQLKPIDGLSEILPLLKSHPSLAKIRFFLSGNNYCGGDRPLDRLRLGDVKAVKHAARQFGEHGST